jgi:hypothetical protein
MAYKLNLLEAAYLYLVKNHIHSRTNYREAKRKKKDVRKAEDLKRPISSTILGQKLVKVDRPRTAFLEKTKYHRPFSAAYSFRSTSPSDMPLEYQSGGEEGEVLPSQFLERAMNDYDSGHRTAHPDIEAPLKRLEYYKRKELNLQMSSLKPQAQELDRGSMQFISRHADAEVYELMPEEEEDRTELVLPVDTRPPIDTYPLKEEETERKIVPTYVEPRVKSFQAQAEFQASTLKSDSVQYFCSQRRVNAQLEDDFMVKYLKDYCKFKGKLAQEKNRRLESAKARVEHAAPAPAPSAALQAVKPRTDPASVLFVSNSNLNIRSELEGIEAEAVAAKMRRVVSANLSRVGNVERLVDSERVETEHLSIGRLSPQKSKEFSAILRENPVDTYRKQ